MYAKLTGTGQYLPSRVMTNDELAQYVETSDDWIRQRVGIASRRIASPTETVVFMATESAKHALEAAKISPESLDLIVVATSSAEDRMPSVASQVQRNLGMTSGCPAFDISAACSGFVYGLHLVEQYLRSGAAKRVLLIGAERMSRLMDWTDRSTCVLFGDGAGAMIFEVSETPGVLATCIHSEGQYRELLFVEGGMRDDPFDTADAIAPVALRMEGNKVFKHAVNILAQVAEEVMHKAGMTAADIDWLVPHQANERIILATAKKLDLPVEKIILTLAEHGNTSAASIPLALDVGIRSGRIQPGDTVLCEAFGAGFVWGASVIRM